MSEVKKPNTAKEMTEQLWWAVIGTNGEGLAAVVRENREDIQEIKRTLPTLQTKAEYVAAQEEVRDKHRRRRWRRTDVVLAFGMIVTAGATAWAQFGG